MTSEAADLAGQMVTGCAILSEQGLVEGFGHLSARLPGDRILMTPRKALALVHEDELLTLDLDGNVLLRWGGADAAAPGNFCAPHGIWVDDQGAIYLAEVTNTIGVKPGYVPEGTHTLQKFARV